MPMVWNTHTRIPVTPQTDDAMIVGAETISL